MKKIKTRRNSVYCSGTALSIRCSEDFLKKVQRESGRANVSQAMLVEAAIKVYLLELQRIEPEKELADKVCDDANLEI